MIGEYIFYDKNVNVNIFMEKWVEIGLSFFYNELCVFWKLGGQVLVQWLGDKDYFWCVIQLLIFDMIVVGLLGYYYICFDMVGGG